MLGDWIFKFHEKQCTSICACIKMFYPVSMNILQNNEINILNWSLSLLIFLQAETLINSDH